MLKRNLHHCLISLKILLIFLIVSEISCEQLDHQHEPNKHFVLIHGACLGAWSWYKLLPLLKSLGHTVTAIDLAASGTNPLQPNDLHTISQYFQPLTDFMVSLSSDRKVILVGHSLGGLAISHAMEHFPEKISVSVFISAQMPGPALNVSVLSQKIVKRNRPELDNKFAYDDGPNNPPTTFLFGPNFLSQKVYDLSPPEDVDLSTMLVRPIRRFSMEDMSKVLVLSEEKYGLVPRVYIISEEDKIIDKQGERWMIEKNPPNRVEKIGGSDHMVMVSQPLQLWAHLQNIAGDFK